MKMEKKVQYGEIYYYDFGERSGSCQRGLHPALVIQEDQLELAENGGEETNHREAPPHCRA